jgi:hypothetical protein
MTMEFTNPHQQIDWDSQRVEVKLAVELPFWVLVEDHRYDVEINGLTLELETVSDGIDVQRGTLHSRTHRRCSFFGRIPDENERGIHNTIDLIQGANFRRTRTQCWITTSVLGDPLSALEEDSPRSRIAMEYFVSVAMAHIPFVNKLVNAYRRVAGDPFSGEITEHDVPVWFLVSDGDLCPLHLVPALGQDHYPVLSSEVGREPDPYRAASPDEINLALSRQPVPGEVELRDAWSLCYRGRFADSIRSAVTAIEVLLEARLESVLKTKGLNDADVADQLATTRNRFALRLDDYCRQSGRAVPGPTLHYLPYLNGLSLRREFEITRDLRHDIVHRGRRLDLSLRRPMRRALETTTWLFDWLSDDEPIGDRQIANYAYCESLRGSPRMRWEIDSNGVHVTPLFNPSPDDGDQLDAAPTCLAELPEARIIDSIEVDEIPDGIFHATLNQFPDLEHFVLMAMAKLGFSDVEDIFQDPEVTHRLPRWRAQHGAQPVSVFLFDSGDEFSDSNLQELSPDIASHSQQSFPLLVVHDRNGIPWTNRSTESVDSKTAAEAVSRGIRIVRSHDLARFASASIANSWSDSEVAAELLSPGWSRMDPPNTKIVGTVRRYFPKLNCISINLNGTGTVGISDRLWVRLRNALTPFQVQSIQQNKLSVRKAQTGCIGVEVELTPNLVVSDSDVFLDMNVEVAPSAGQQTSALRELLGGFRGGY